MLHTEATYKVSSILKMTDLEVFFCRETKHLKKSGNLSLSDAPQ